MSIRTRKRLECKTTGTADDRIPDRVVDAIRRTVSRLDELHDRVERHATMLAHDISDVEAMKTPAESFLYRQLESYFRFRTQEKQTCQAVRDKATT